MMGSIHIPMRSGKKPQCVLDLIPGASLAVSSSHLLSSQFGGGMVRMLRTSDNEESWFTAHQWLNGDAPRNFVGGGNAKAVMVADQSGNDRHAVQSTLSSQPLIMSGGDFLDANRSMQFDHTAVNWMEFLRTEGLVTGLAGFTVLFCGRITTGTGSGFPTIFGNARGTSVYNTGGFGIASQSSNFICLNEVGVSTRKTTNTVGSSITSRRIVSFSVNPATGAGTGTTSVYGGSSVAVTWSIDGSAFDLTSPHTWKTMIGTQSNGSVDTGRMWSGFTDTYIVWPFQLSVAQQQLASSILSSPSFS
jgi:hypothetical protein